MKAETLKGKTADELRADLMQLRKEALNLRFQKASGQLENTARMRLVRRDIARIKTVMGAGTAPAGGAKAAKTRATARKPAATAASTPKPRAKAKPKAAAKAKARK